MDLSPKLPAGKLYSAIHLRTTAYECKPLKISKKKPLTLKVKHLLLLLEKDTRRIILGIEVYVYLTFNESELERHFFILKADTTGLSSRRISAAGVTKTFLEYLISIDPKVYWHSATYRKTSEKGEKTANKNKDSFSGGEYLTSSTNDRSIGEESTLEIVQELRVLGAKLKKDPQFIDQFFKFGRVSVNNSSSELPVRIPTSLSTKISLFTRPADAYLFPKSETNKQKHIIDGNTLFKWWISILDCILDGSWLCKADIPGSDRVSVGKFIPQKDNWEIGNIYVTSNSKTRAVHTIPLFPDDPKGRFLEHLIVENRYKSVNTRQFWEELGFRQEFRLGNVVGIIGCSKDSTIIHGIQEDTSTSILTPKQYKKIREQVKGEDYGKSDDILDLWESGLSELAATLRAKLQYISISGTMPVASTKWSALNPSSPKASPVAVNILPTKRKSQPINNISGLVKRKAK